MGWDFKTLAFPKKMVGLMRCLSSHLHGHHPVEHDSYETDGVLDTKKVRHETDENPGRVRR
jgi:hypothetical protein